MDDRAEIFRQKYLGGMTLQEIGAENGGLSRERVRQIIARRFGSLRSIGGAKARSVAAGLARDEARDARYMHTHGCTFSQYMALRGPITLAFIEQKRNARQRGIGWNLKFWEWWSIWQASGRWGERGRTADQYVMCRFGDSGPYEVGNVYIDTASNNISGGYQHRDRNPWWDRGKFRTTC